MKTDVTAAALAVLARVLPRRYHLTFYAQTPTEDSYVIEVRWGETSSKTLRTADQVLRFTHSVMNES